MLNLADELDPAKATHILKLAALTYAAMVVPPALAFLPRDERVMVGHAALAASLLVVSATLALAQARTVIRSQGHRAPGALGLLVQNLLCYGIAGCFATALSGSAGIYRVLVLGPLLWMAVIGNRVMYGISAVAAVVTLAAVTFGAGGAMGPAVTVFVVHLVGFVCAAQFVRVLAQAAFAQGRQHDRFAELAAIAAGAVDVRHGFEQMLPTTTRFVGVDAAAVYRVEGRSVIDVPVATHPAAPPLEPKQLADLRVAAWDRRPLTRERWSCLAVEGTDGVAYVLFLVHGRLGPLARPVHDHAVAQVATQLSVLHTRLSLLNRLEGLTRTDALTALPNRRALTEHLDQQLAVSGRSGAPLSLVMIDLDHFKTYNDTFGHVAGDDLLVAVADLLASRRRKSDFVARFGGEEFCLVLAATDAGAGAVLLQELHRRCRELPAERIVTFSAGIAEWDGDEDVVALLERADEALYRAKRAGRDRTVAHTPAAPTAVASVPMAALPVGEGVVAGS